VKKGSGSGLDALEGWTKLYGLEQPPGDLFGSHGGDWPHATLAPNPIGNGCLMDAESLGSQLLGPEVLNELSVDGVHVASLYGNDHILEYGHNLLQAHGQYRENSRMNFGQRLKAARKYAGLTQTTLATKVGMDQTTISDLERGKSSSSSFCASIAKTCGVDALWLETGQGDMRPKETSSPTDNGVNVEPLQVHEASVLALSDFQRVPLISWVAAGAWSEAIDLYEVGDAEVWMPCPDPIGPRGFALRVEGDSMTSPYPGSESYPHGTFIYVDPDVAHKSGDPVIAKLPASNSATFKIFIEDAGQCYLKPLNPQHPMIPITEETHIVAVLVGAYKRR
jgi:SOS-response transcriptional repressor LexA